MAPWPRSRGCALCPVGAILPALFSSLGATEGLRSPVGHCVCQPPASLPGLQGPKETHLCFLLLQSPLPTLPPRGVARPEVHALSPGRRKGRVTHSARATSAVSRRNCFLRLVHTSFTVCWSRPTCRKPHPHMHTGSHGQIEGGLGRGRSTDWGHHEVGRDGQMYRGRRGTLGLGSYPLHPGGNESWHPRWD